MLTRERANDRPYAAGTVGIQVGGCTSGRRDLGFSLCRRRAGRQPRKDLEIRAIPWAVLQGVEPQRDPELIVDGKREALRHDADNRVQRAAQLNRPADDVRIRVEAQPPRLVSDHEDRRRARLFVGAQQIAAEERRRLRELEGRRRDLRYRERFRRRVGRDEIELRRTERAHLVQRRQVIAPCGKGMKHVRVGASRVRRHVLHRNDTIALREGQRRIEQGVDDVERRRARRNRHRHRDDADEREPAVFAQHADAEPRVERQAIEPIEPARLAPLFLVTLDAAEADEGLGASLLPESARASA